MAGRAGGRAQAWGAAQGRAEWLWPARLQRAGRGAFERARVWANAELAPGRLLPWLAIAFGTGIVGYFAADHEPLTAAAVALLAVLAIATFAARLQPIAFALLLATAALAAGFATASVRSALVAHPILRQPAWNLEIDGWVEQREVRPRTDRVVIKVHRIEGTSLDPPLRRVRVSVPKGTAPPVGGFIAFKARLEPPRAPLRPGGYDLARDLYFQGIGATGFALGAIRKAEAPEPPGAWLR